MRVSLPSRFLAGRTGADRTSRTDAARRSGLLRKSGLVAALAGTLLLAACQADEFSYGYGPKDKRPIAPATLTLMTKLGMNSSSPVLMRIFKEENRFEVWKKDNTGRYALLKSYEICKWSGDLGPKIREGDRQAPEGFYNITPGLMNPNSDWYLAFNTGFPNTYDRVNGRTGSALMVHGSCSSRGCYAMTDAQIQEIYALARDAFKGGQRSFQLQALPFRLTAENMAKHWNDPNMPFWKMLKEGYDTFEITHLEPKVDVCGRKYVFNANPDAPLDAAQPCPALNQPADLENQLQARAKADDAKAGQLFAALEVERKAKQEKDKEIAVAEAERQRRIEERRVAAANNPGMLASLFSASEGGATEAIVGGPVIVPATGAPVPVSDPRGSAFHQEIDVSEPPAPSSSLMSLFARATGRPSPAAVQLASPSIASASATASPVATLPAPQATGPVAAAPVAAAPVVATASATPVCVATATAPCPVPAAAETPAIRPAPQIQPRTQSPGLFDRLRSLF